MAEDEGPVGPSKLEGGLIHDMREELLSEESMKLGDSMVLERKKKIMVSKSIAFPDKLRHRDHSQSAGPFSPVRELGLASSS